MSYNRTTKWFFTRSFAVCTRNLSGAAPTWRACFSSSPSHRPNAALFAAALACAAALCAAPGAYATVTGTWINSAGGNWSTLASDWNVAVPGSSTTTNSADVAEFNSTLNGGTGVTINVDTNRNIKIINIDSTGGNYTFDIQGSNILKITSAGAIQNNASGSFGNTFSDTGSIQLEGAVSFTNNDANSSAAFSFATTISNGAAATLTLNGSNTGLNTISGLITPTTGTLSLTKSGTGTWYLTNANNNYTGLTTVGNGTLSINSVGAINGGTGGLALGATTTGGTFIYTGAAGNITGALSLPGTTGGGVIENDGSGALNFTNTATITAGTNNKILTLQGAGGGKIAGNIVDGTLGSKTTGVTVNSGTWVLTGANLYTGATSITGGTLQMGAGSALSTTAVTISNSGVLDLGISTSGVSFSPTIQSLASASSSAVVQNSSTGGTAVLQVNAGATYAGAIQGSIAFTVAGGTQILTGTNTYTGATIINSGATLQIGAGSTGSIANTASITDNGTLAYNLGATTVTVPTLDVASTGGITQAGSGILVISAPVPASLVGTMTASAGTLQLQGGPNTLNAANNVVLGNAGTVAGTLDMYGQSQRIGSLTSSGGAVNSVTSSVAGAGAISLTLNTSGTATSNAVISSGSSTVSLVMAGTGTQTLSGVSTYTGSTTILSGAIKLGTSHALGGTNSTTALTIGSGSNTATLDLNTKTVEVSSINSAGSSPATNDFIINSTPATFGTININPTGAGTATYAGVIGAGINLKLSGPGGGVFPEQVISGNNTAFNGTVNGDTALLTFNGANSGLLGASGLSITGGSLAARSGVQYTGAAPSFAQVSTPATITLGGYVNMLEVSNSDANLSNPSAGGIVRFNPTTMVTPNNTGVLLYLTGSGVGQYDGLIKDYGTGSPHTGVVKADAGTWFLTNTNNTFTYGGNGTNAGIQIGTSATTSGGILNVSSLAVEGSGGGTPSAMGQSSNSSINLKFVNGTLQYTGYTASGALTGGSQTTDRAFWIGDGTNAGGTAIIDASGPVGTTLTWQAGGGGGVRMYATVANANPYYLTLTGSNTGANSFAPSIGDPGGTAGGVVIVTKSGVGTWVLAGSSTYTGATNINSGTLRIGTLNAILKTSPVTLGDGTNSVTLDLGGNNLALNSLTANAGNLANEIVNNSTGSSTLTLSPTVTANFNGNLQDGGGTLAVNIKGTAGIVQTLTGASNTYSGGTTLTSGILQLAANSNIGSATGAVNFAGGTLQFANSTTDPSSRTMNFNSTAIIDTNGYNVVLANAVGGGQSGGLTKSGGTGTLTLSAALNYTGSTTVASDTLIVGNGLGSNTSGFVLGSGGNNVVLQSGIGGVGSGWSAVPLTLPGTTGSVTIDNEGAAPIAFTMTGTPGAGIKTLTLEGAGGGSIAGAIANNSTTNKTSLAINGGTWVLTATNTYTGATTIQQGTLRVGVPNGINSASAVTIGDGTHAATLDLGYGATSNNLSLASLTSNVGAGSATITNSDSSGGTATLTLTPAAALAFAGSIVDGTGHVALTLNAAQTLTLTGANTYTGSTQVLQGTVSMGTLSNLASTSAIALGSTTHAGTLIYTGAGGTTAALLTLPGTTGGGTITNNGSGPIVFSNTGALATGAGSKLFTLQGNGGGTIAGLINDNGTNTQHTSLLVNAGTWLLTNVNTYGGSTSVTGGTLRMGGAFALSTSTGVTLSNSATFDLGNGSNSYNQSIASLAGASTSSIVTNSDSNAGDTATLTLNTTGTVTYAGIIKDDGKIALTMAGTGTQVLTGVNTYTGPTTITAGALQANDNAGLPGASSTGGGSNLVLSGGVLQSNGVASFTRDLGAGQTNVQWATSGGFSASGGAFTVNIGGGASDPLVWGSTGSFVASGNALLFGSATASNTVTMANSLDLAGAARTVQVTAGAGGDAAVLAGTLFDSSNTIGAINKTGTGALVLIGANTYTGSTTITAGALQANDNAGLPGASSVGGGSNLVLNGGVLQGDGVASFTRDLGIGQTQVQWALGTDGGFSANGGTFTVNIGGAGATLTWGSTPNFVSTGNALVMGSLNANAQTELQNGIDLNGAARTVQAFSGAGGDSSLLSGAIIDSTNTLGGIIKTAGGVLILSNPGNSYSGSTTITNGALQATDGVGLPTASNLVLNGGVFQTTSGSFTRSLGTGGNQVQWTTTGGFSAASNPLTVTLSGVTPPLVWGSTSNFVGTGSSLLFSSLSANNTVTFTHDIDLNGAARTVQVTDSATAPGSDPAVLSGVLSDGSLTKAGNGLLILGGSNTYTGTTTINAGAIQAADGVGLPSGSNLKLAGGGVFQSSGSFTRALGTGAGQVQWTAAGGFSADGGPLTVNLGPGTAIKWGGTGATPSFVPTASSLVFGSSSANNVVTFANSIDLNGAVHTVQVNAGTGGDSALLSGAITNSSSTAPAGLTKTGTGTLTISGSNFNWGASGSAGGTLNVNAGTVNLLGDAGASGNQSLTVATANTGTALNLAVSQHVAGLTVGDGSVVTLAANGDGTVAGGRAIVTSNLSLGGTNAGTLDLKNNVLVWKGDGSTTTGAAHELQVQSWLSTAYNGGDWLGTSGITSTLLQAGNGGDPAKYALAYALADNVSGLVGNTLFNTGETINSGDVVVMYTIRGDISFAGSAGFDSLIAVLNNLDGPANWVNGNYHYGVSGTDLNVGFDDLITSLNNLDVGIPTAGGSVTPLGAIGETVPEPATLSLLALGGLLVLRRRR